MFQLILTEMLGQQRFIVVMKQKITKARLPMMELNNPSTDSEVGMHLTGG